MSSSFVRDCSDASAPLSSSGQGTTGTVTPATSSGNKTVFIIVNNDTQIDQDQLSSLLASHAGPSSEVSVVQMAGGSGGSDGYGTHDPTSTLQAAAAVGLLNPASGEHAAYHTVDGIGQGDLVSSSGGYSELPLDAESLHQLESVLCTDEARQILGGDPLLEMLTPSSVAQHSNGMDYSSSIFPTTSSSSGSGVRSVSSRGGGRRRGRGAPKRRSQRQQDKAERDEVCKILAENQRMLQLEREQLLAASTAAASSSPSSVRPINNVNIEVQVEFDHQTRKLQNKGLTVEDGYNANELGDDGVGEEEDGEEEEEKESGSDNDEELSADDSNDDEYSERSSCKSRGTFKRGSGVSGRGGRGGARSPTRGRPRGRPPKSVTVPVDRGGGKGRGVRVWGLAATQEEGEESVGGRRATTKVRAAPSVRARGRGCRGRGSKGKQMPVMPDSEEEEDYELPDLDKANDVGATSVSDDVAAPAADDIDNLEKQLSDLHGESGHSEEDSTPTTTPTPASLHEVLTAAPATSPNVATNKKIVFLKKGTTMGASGARSARQVRPVEEDAVEGDSKQEEALVPTQTKKEKGNNDRNEASNVRDDDDRGDNDVDEDDGDEDEGDDDYKPPHDITNIDPSPDATLNETDDSVKVTKKKKVKATKPSKSKSNENSSPNKKQKKVTNNKKQRLEKSHLKKKVIQRVIDKRGNVRFVTRKISVAGADEDDKNDVKSPKKSKVLPPERDYLKILELAQMNVEAAAAQTSKKVFKPSLPDPKTVIKKMRETMAEGKVRKPSGDNKEHRAHASDEMLSKSVSKKVVINSAGNNSGGSEAKPPPSPSVSPTKNLQKSPHEVLTQKKPKIFSAALEVPYEALKKSRFGKKTSHEDAKSHFARTHDEIIKRVKQDESQSYKDANKVLLNKLENKLGKVAKNTSVVVSLVQQNKESLKQHKKPSHLVKKEKHVSPLKRTSGTPKHKQTLGGATRYKEEFDDEDEELDDMEEYRPLSPVLEENVRRSNRPPKKKSFGDEMIMLDEQDGSITDEDQQSDESGEGSEDGEDNNEEEAMDNNDRDFEVEEEDDADQHTLRRRRGGDTNNKKSDLQQLTTVDLEVVDELPKKETAVEEEEGDDEEEDSSDDEFVEEDDPEKLWCMCQRPHNNRFMICCDRCEDWFHGSCVGINKAMGKQMEEAGQEWVCPRCRRTASVSSDHVLDPLTHPRREECSASGCGAPVASGSLFCSRACTLLHAASVIRSGQPGGQLHVADVSGCKPRMEQQVKAEPRVLVANKTTGQVLADKNAPTLSELTDWLRRHPDYALVKPSAVNSSPKSGSTFSSGGHAGTAREGVKTVPKPSRVTINVSKAAAEAGFRDTGPSGSNSAPAGYSGARKTILLTSVRAPSSTTNAASTTDVAAEKETEDSHQYKRRGTADGHREKPAKHSKKRIRSDSDSKPDPPPTPPAVNIPSPYEIRNNVRKALTESLLKRVEENRTEFPDLTPHSIESLVGKIEEELYLFFSKSVSIKYKSRYRSLVFNIRDSKNGGLYRQILTGAVSPQKLATMTSDEMASKELAEWRQTQGKKELEAIQKHELDMISLGNTYIMKSHKGEIEIAKDDFILDKEKAPETLNKLPEEEPLLQEELTTPTKITTITSDFAAERDSSSSSKLHHRSSRDSKDRKRDADEHRDRKRSSRDSDKNRRHSTTSREGDRDRKHSSHHDRDRDKDRDRDGRKRRHSESRKDDGSDSAHKRRHSDKRDTDRERRDSYRDRVDGDRDRKDSDRDRRDSDRSRSDHGKDRDRQHHHRRGSDSKRSKNDEVSTSDDVVNDKHDLSAIAEERERRDAEPSSTVGLLPGERNYGERARSQTLQLPPNLLTHLPGEQEDDLVDPTSPLPVDEDPSYIPPYSPEAIPPQSPIPSREDTSSYLLSSPQTPLEDNLSPGSTPPPPITDEDGGGEYSPSAPPFSTSAKKISKYRPSPYGGSRKRFSSSCLSKFDLPLAPTGEQIAIWRGAVLMNDVSKFSAMAFEVSGGSINFTQDIPEAIEVVGRIAPDNVWTYIADTKKAASKEVLVVRFQPTCEEEKVSYITLYTYLSSKKRYGVVGNCDCSVKDFYIIPLASHQPIPQVLLPLDGPGFEEQRPHMLVGVVVRTKPKRVYDQFSGTWKDLPDQTKLSEESNAMLFELKEASERSFTPPLPLGADGSAGSEEAVPYEPEDEDEKEDVALEKIKKTTRVTEEAKKNEVEEQHLYSPIGTPIHTPPGAPDVLSDDDDDIVELPTPVNKAVKRAGDSTGEGPVKKTRNTDLSAEQESMLAELNRQIEQHKRELKTMQLTVSSSTDDKSSELNDSVIEEITEIGNNTKSSKNVNSEQSKLDTTLINIPDNLHMILENIKRKENEIKEKEAEILRRKNEVLVSMGGDTDMRLLLPPSLQRGPPPHVSQTSPITTQIQTISTPPVRTLPHAPIPGVPPIRSAQPIRNPSLPPMTGVPLLRPPFTQTMIDVSLPAPALPRPVGRFSPPYIRSATPPLPPLQPPPHLQPPPSFRPMPQPHSMVPASPGVPLRHAAPVYPQSPSLPPHAYPPPGPRYVGPSHHPPAREYPPFSPVNPRGGVAPPAGHPLPRGDFYGSPAQPHYPDRVCHGPPGPQPPGPRGYEDQDQRRRYRGEWERERQHHEQHYGGEEEYYGWEEEGERWSNDERRAGRGRTGWDMEERRWGRGRGRRWNGS